jgi:hypothetical protein
LIKLKLFLDCEETTSPFVISALDVGKWSASRFCRFTLAETAPGYTERKNILSFPEVEDRFLGIPFQAVPATPKCFT